MPGPYQNKIITNAINTIKRLDKIHLADCLQAADKQGRQLYQPRSGVGDQQKMIDLLDGLKKLSKPDILSITIDAHTRLNNFDLAKELMEVNPDALNGYPLVAHGHKQARLINKRYREPVQIRHGSPDPITLFIESILGGFTAFEGGPISYNLPYCKDVSLAHTLKSWKYVDTMCGILAGEGIIVDREMFGSLSGVLVPPSISLAISFIEARLAADYGVRCISIAYPQGGNIIQDVAALQAIRDLSDKYMKNSAAVYPILHEFMGVFPRDKISANALIFYGALTARLGKATKIVTKTNHEAFGVPTTEANAEGINLSRMASTGLFDFIEIDDTHIQEEKEGIIREVDELMATILDGTDVEKSILNAFLKGLLDIPFSASRQAHSKVLPTRDAGGAIRFGSFGKLPFSFAVKKRNNDKLANDDTINLQDRVVDSIYYFANACDQ